MVVPRAKPAPKEKPKTKWEKFREEKGLPSRKKRSRLIFDEITKDWVPRWGPGSKAQIAKKHEWLLEDNSGVEGGADPFTVKKQEKKMQLEKENLKRMKNELHAIKAQHGKSTLKKGVNEVLASSNVPNVKAGFAGNQDKKLEQEHRKNEVKKRERKALDKSLSLAQLSTASMGKFDKKVSKHEPDAPNSQKILKKKSNFELAKLMNDRKGEKERNLKILNFVQRAGEVQSNSKADAHFNVDKMVGKKQRKEENARRKDK